MKKMNGAKYRVTRFARDNKGYFKLHKPNYPITPIMRYQLVIHLCPNTEYLDLSKKRLQSFTKGTLNFTNKTLEELLSFLPCLEKIYLYCTAINGNFDLLPKGLKELNKSSCKISEKNLR